MEALSPYRLPNLPLQADLTRPLQMLEELTDLTADSPGLTAK